MSIELIPGGERDIGWDGRPTSPFLIPPADPGYPHLLSFEAQSLIRLL